MDLFKSISTKAMLGYIAIICVSLITTILLFKRAEAISSENSRFVTQTLPALRGIEQTLSTLNSIEIDAFALYGTTLSSSEFSKSFDAHQKQLTTSIQELNENKQITDMSSQLISSVKSLQGVMAKSRVNWDQARQELSGIQSQANTLKANLDKLKTQHSDTAAQGVEQINQSIASMRQLVIFGISAISFITLLAYLLTQRWIVSPAVALSNKLDNIAMNYDLTETVPVHSKDEIGNAAESINRLITAFRQGSEEVLQSARSIVDSVESLTGSATKSDQQVHNLSASTTALLGKVDVLENSTAQNANRSLDASETARTGADQVHSGATEVQQTAANISELATDIEKSSEMLLNLQNAGNQVSSVVSTIADIAEQTNLLALNAAIEAARAGESGRGFAVVADEVRMLASRTHESTNEINSILDSIVESISMTVNSMDTNKAKANHAVEQAQTTVTSLDAIQQTVIALSDENHNLAELAQGAKNETNEMRVHLDKFNQASESVMQSIQDTRSAADNFNNLASGLNQVINQFRVK